MKKLAVIGLVLSATMLIGCGSKNEAKTPQEAVQGFWNATMANEVDDAMAYVKVEGDEKPVRELVEMMGSLLEFGTAVEETYGKGSLKKLGITQPTEEFSVEEYFEFKIDGDTAKATPKKKGPMPMDLVKVDGVWRIKMASAEAAATVGMMKMVVGPVKMMRSKVDKEKYPFEKFKAEYDAEG
jgi:hypothetical protein